MDQLQEALLTLDPEDAAHWTEDGLPVVQVVADMVGQELTREQITEIAPQFSRDALKQIRADADTVDQEDLPKVIDPDTSLAAQLRDLDEAINELTEERHAIEASLSSAHKQRSVLGAKIAARKNNGTNQQAISQAIALSNKQRAARVQAAKDRRALLGEDPRSPLERSRDRVRVTQPLRHPAE